MECRKFRANNILFIVVNYFKRLHIGEEYRVSCMYVCFVVYRDNFSHINLVEVAQRYSKYCTLRKLVWEDT